MIPKIIHYCWFGNKQKSAKTLEYIEGRKKILPDYRFIEWNECNCDIYDAPDFVREAYRKGKWAFVSDYFRLKALYDFGGVYFDTDVELLSRFDNLMNNDFFCCFESNSALCTAFLASCKNSKIIYDFLLTYEKRNFSEIPNSYLLFQFLLGSKSIDMNNSYYITSTVFILPYYYFSPINYYTRKRNINCKTIAIHHYESTRKSKRSQIFDFFKIIAFKILGEKRYIKLKNKVKK